MMTIDDVLFFDCETTGIPERNWRWDEDYEKFPHIVQLSWMHGNIVENHIIRPEGWDIPESTVEVHGITTEYALEHGEPFAGVVDMFINDCHDAALICGHNIYFDTSIIKANILRDLGSEYYSASGVGDVLDKGKRIDTMRSTMKWVDARMANGRLKFPNLSELYSRCFPGESFPAHDALEDVKAVARCLPVLVEQGLVELKVKEYPQEQSAESKQAESSEKAVKAPILNVNEKDNKLPNESPKGPQNDFSAKITGVAAELLGENDF